MTAVPRLQLLPPPGATPGALAVAAPGQGDVRVQPVTPAKTAQQNRQGFRQATIDEHEAKQRLANGGRPTQARIGEDSRQDRSGRSAQGREAASGRLAPFSRLTSMPFMVQVLGQHAGGGRAQPATPENSLTGHRDAALLGSDIYRKAGGEPEILPDDATFVRLAV